MSSSSLTASQSQATALLKQWPSDALSSPEKAVLEHKIFIAFQVLNPEKKVSRTIDKDGTSVTKIEEIETLAYASNYDHGEFGDPRALPSAPEERRQFMLKKLKQALEKKDYEDEGEKDEILGLIKSLESSSGEDCRALVHVAPISNEIVEDLSEWIPSVKRALTKHFGGRNYRELVRIQKIRIEVLVKDLKSSERRREIVNWGPSQVKAISQALLN